MNKPLAVSLDLRSIFEQLGIGPNDLILVHDHPLLKRLLGGPAQLIDELSKYLNEGTLCTYQIMDHYQKAEIDDLALRDGLLKQQLDFDTKRFRDSNYHALLLAMNRLQGRVFHSNEAVVFCSWGHDSRYLCSLVGEDFPFGQDSPFRGLYDLKAKILFFNDDFLNLHELQYGYVFENEQPIRKVSTLIQNKSQDYLDYVSEPWRYKPAIEQTEKKKSITMGPITFTLVDYQQAAINLVTQ